MLSEKRITILGGYGTTGRLIARGLLRYSDVRLIVAGRNPERAAACAGELNSEFPGMRVSAEKLDAAERSKLRESFRETDMVVVASSTSAFARGIVEAALDEGIDYFDIQYFPSKFSYLMSIERDVERRGLCFITDGGFHPGLPGVLVRLAACRFDAIREAIVASLIRIDWKALDVGRSTAEEFITAISDYDSSAFQDGSLKKASFFSSDGYVREDFGPPFGRRYCAPMFLEEMQRVQELFPTMTRTGFYVAGFNWFIDYLVLPLAMFLTRVSPGRGAGMLSDLLVIGMKKFSRPPYSTILKLHASGESEGRERELEACLSHEDGYALTAAPVVAAIVQYLDGTARKPGVFTQAEIVDPERLLEDLTRMGMKWTMSWKG